MKVEMLASFHFSKEGGVYGFGNGTMEFEYEPGQPWSADMETVRVWEKEICERIGAKQVSVISISPLFGTQP